MITFTPLSGAARESRTTPLCYLLHIDDVRILIDCGSPDWAPELSPFNPEQTEEERPSWKEYCEALQKYAKKFPRISLFSSEAFPKSCTNGRSSANISWRLGSLRAVSLGILPMGPQSASLYNVTRSSYGSDCGHRGRGRSTR
jgi:hypothetical protein